MRGRQRGCESARPDGLQVAADGAAAMTIIVMHGRGFLVAAAYIRYHPGLWQPGASRCSVASPALQRRSCSLQQIAELRPQAPGPPRPGPRRRRRGRPRRHPRLPLSRNRGGGCPAASRRRGRVRSFSRCRGQLQCAASPAAARGEGEWRAQPTGRVRAEGCSCSRRRGRPGYSLPRDRTQRALLSTTASPAFSCRELVTAQRPRGLGSGQVGLLGFDCAQPQRSCIVLAQQRVCHGAAAAACGGR